MSALAYASSATSPSQHATGSFCLLFLFIYRHVVPSLETKRFVMFVAFDGRLALTALVFDMEYRENLSAQMLNANTRPAFGSRNTNGRH